MKSIYQISIILLIIVILLSVIGGNDGYFTRKIMSSKYPNLLFMVPYIMLLVVIVLWMTDKDTDNNN
jgi:hypothetical protein